MITSEADATAEARTNDSWHRRTFAIQALLAEKGVLSDAEVEEQIADTNGRHVGLAATLIARAWIDADFKARLLENAGKVAGEFHGLDLSGPEIVALESTPTLHHVVVCTLCSCYPRALMGIPPYWYKDLAYRSRAVVDPRGVLAEFGTAIPDGVQIRVVDATADARYLVLPVRPAGTEGWTEDRLAGLITAEVLLGVSLPQA
jgi:nitrile hydratase